MEINRFVSSYEVLRDRLNKKQITDSYIENVAKAYKVEKWDEKLFEDLINELSVKNPYTVDISAKIISEKYYAKLRDSQEFKFGKKNCKHKLCDGTGIIFATKIIHNKEFDYCFRCVCDMGNNHNQKISKWSEEKTIKGFRINKLFTYSEGEEKQYNTKKLVDVIGSSFD